MIKCPWKCNKMKMILFRSYRWSAIREAGALGGFMGKSRSYPVWGGAEEGTSPKVAEKGPSQPWCGWASQSLLPLGETNGWRGATEEAAVAASGRPSAPCELTAKHLLEGLESPLGSRASSRGEGLDSEEEKHEPKRTHWALCGCA